MAMKLSTGKIAFPIEFDNGDKQSIYFNPNDPNLSIRLKDFQAKVSQRIEKLKDIQLNADGSPNEIEMIEDFRKIQNVVFEELDVAFGGEISSVVFKHCSPFAIVDGKYFIIQFIEAIKPEITKHVRKANADIESKMRKLTEGYTK